jgi:hypothetical protein
MIALPDDKVACTKACHLNALKALSGQIDSGRGNWTNDGIMGVDDPNTSMKILLDWMLEEGNYSRYRGKDNNGIKKNQFASALCEQMALLTTSKNRTAKQIQSKISYIEESFRTAHIFATSETGAGIQEKEGKETFKDYVRKKFLYYYELCPIMADRSGTEPKLTNLDNRNLDKFSDDDTKEDDDGNYYNDASEKFNGTDDNDTSYNDNRPPKYISTPTKVNDTEIEECGTTTTKRSMMDEDSSISKRSIMCDNTSSKKHKKKNSKSSSQQLLDDNTLSMLDIANQQSIEKLAEQKRHNRIVEKSNIEKNKREETRLQLESWKGRNDELNYKVNLVSQYTSLRNQGLTQQQVLHMFPEMQSVSTTLESVAVNVPENDDNAKEYN